MERDGKNYVLLGHYYYTAKEKAAAFKEYNALPKKLKVPLGSFWDLYGKQVFGETPWDLGGRFEAGNLEGNSYWNYEAQVAYDNLPFKKFAKFHSSFKSGSVGKYVDSKATYEAMMKQLHDDSNYTWNLPPHKWSTLAESVDILSPSAPRKRGANFHSNRRGVIRWMGSPETKYTYEGKPVKAANDDSRKYGFQFLWNPETYQTTVAFNSGVVPTIADQFTSGPGFYPGFEQVSFTLRLDRTNDFACFKALGVINLSDKEKRDFVAKYYPYQKANQSTNRFSHTPERKLESLMQRGTLGDLEYLYRTLNGDQFINKPGKFDTADMGFLMLSIVKIELGPASYVGWITGISIDHIAFSESYIPIRTDVSVTVNVLTNAAPVANAPDDPKDPRKPGGQPTPGNPAGSGAGGTAAIDRLAYN